MVWRIGRGIGGWAAALVLAWAMIGAGAAQARSVALVIGNSAYKHGAPLLNPANDAADVGAALRRLGFEVIPLRNGSYDQMRRAMARFRRRAAGAEVAVIYYAGHGIGVDGETWLVPVDATLKNQDEVEFQTIPLSLALRSVRGATALRLVVLDACRDNPFLTKMAPAPGASRSFSRGLARVEPSGDTLVWYAAKDGSTASDGVGRNSPFTAAFLKHVERPGLEIGRFFRLITADVRKATREAQAPWQYGTRGLADFYFKPASGPVTPVAPTAIERDRVAFELAMSIEDAKSRAAALRAFLKRYPRSSLRRSAEIALKSAVKPIAIASTKPAAAETSSRFEARLRAAGKKGAKECAACP
ncbi:MAG: caspase family protein, partial [Neomegalonema sp.]|nr:caspase family protein [Neomegalonema sp.]